MELLFFLRFLLAPGIFLDFLARRLSVRQLWLACPQFSSCRIQSPSAASLLLSHLCLVFCFYLSFPGPEVFSFLGIFSSEISVWGSVISKHSQNSMNSAGVFSDAGCVGAVVSCSLVLKSLICDAIFRFWLSRILILIAWKFDQIIVFN